jgi:cellulose biosynthesis protein BcsQ
MLKALEEIRRLEKELAKKKASHEIKDFRIKLHANSTITVFVLYDNEKPDLNGLVGKDDKIDIHLMTSAELEEDSYYISIFNKKEVVDLGSRRRFANLIDIEDKEEINACPIINFYSYKGGVGRSTALAIFASYYAIKYEKKVIVIDCDLEAPGFINFYGIDYEESGKNGIVELIVNSQFTDEKPDLRQNYTFEVSKDFSGNGSIFIIPAGNLSTSLELSDYLEALARIDLCSTTTIRKQFKKAIESIDEEFKPDIILIDNRTGFNDVFGVLGFMFSSIIVGFFGNNRQTRPGLHFFLDTLYKIKGDIGFILVHSILPNSPHARAKNFESEIENYLQQAVAEKLDSIPTFYTYGISRNPSLEDIGTPREDPRVFREFVNTDISRDYLELFEKMTELIDLYNRDKQKEKEEQLLPKSSKEDPGEIRKNILNTLKNKFPEPYAEDIKIDREFLDSNFFFRKCMEDIFNFDKFLLLGGKGTGKTVFYRVLKNDFFFDSLKEKAKKQDIAFDVINVISLQQEKQEFKSLALDNLYTDGNPPQSTRFYTRFWVIYIWNAVMLEQKKTGFNSSFKVEEIKNDASTARRFLNIIDDDDRFIQVEEELNLFDNILKEQNRYLLLLFDQLDIIVKPHEWSEGISPLVNYWRGKPFSRIFGKLFLRRDLFNKMGNLTNKESLRRQAINLEWSPEEMFAFFFKPIFYYSGEQFFKLMEYWGEIPRKTIDEIRGIVKNRANFYQLPPERKILQPVVDTFFGRYFHAKFMKNIYESYSWLYLNLKNADDTISLRPFIDLIKFSVEQTLQEIPLDKNVKPILPASLFLSGTLREKAVKRHFEDLVSEKGNEDLKCIIEYIQGKRIPPYLRYINLYRNQLEKLLKIIIDENPHIKNKNIDGLIKILIDSGIIKEYHLHQGNKKYSFAFLYKYFLGLRG